MKIEEVEALAKNRHNSLGFVDDSVVADKLDIALKDAIEALRAEAWYPIERAEEMGVKNFWVNDSPNPCPWVLGCDSTGKMFVCKWFESSKEWRDRAWPCNPTHFRFINPPEAK